IPPRLPAATATGVDHEVVTAEPAASLRDEVDEAPAGRHRRPRRWWRMAGVAAVVTVLGVELALGWPSLSGALSQFRTPHPGWLLGAVLVEMSSMRAYARMQRRLLRSAGVRASLLRHIALAY